MHAIESLADYVCNFAARDTLPEAGEAALRCVLDLMTASIAGFDAPSVRATRAVAPRLFGAGRATVWFDGASLGSAGAAFCNSAAASVLDLDDGNRAARGHPGAAVIPAALETARETGATASELIAAIVVGYEVAVRVGATRRFHARSGMWCGYGAAAAVGWLRRSSPATLAHALAIAGMTAPNLLSTGGGERYPAPLGNDVKEGIPWATAGAIAAFDLATAGIQGPLDILDHAPHHDQERLVADLVGASAICRTYFKPYACCRHVHAPADAFAAVCTRHSIAPEDIVAIDVFAYHGALLISNRTRPANLVDVQFSIPYCIGLVAVLGVDVLLPLTPEVLDRPDATRIAQKVRLHADPQFDARFPVETLARVVVTTARGRYESPVTAPRGDADNPMPWTELEAKFRTATGATLTEPLQNEVLECVQRLRCGELRPLLERLARPLSAGA